MCLNACRCGCLLAVASLPAACLPAACCLRPQRQSTPACQAQSRHPAGTGRAPTVPTCRISCVASERRPPGAPNPRMSSGMGRPRAGPVVLLRLCRRCVAERVEGRDRGQAGQRARFCADGRRQGAQSAEGRASTPTAASAPGCPRQRPGVHAPPRCAACPSPSGPRAQRRCLHQRHAPGRAASFTGGRGMALLERRGGVGEGGEGGRNVSGDGGGEAAVEAARGRRPRRLRARRAPMQTAPTGLYTTTCT